jgi:hypothetical protein
LPRILGIGARYHDTIFYQHCEVTMKHEVSSANPEADDIADHVQKMKRTWEKMGPEARSIFLQKVGLRIKPTHPPSPG